MAIQRELYDKMLAAKKAGYSDEEIAQALASSKSYPDIAEKAQSFLQAGYTPTDIATSFFGSQIREASQPTHSKEEMAQISQAYKEKLKSKQGGLTEDEIKKLPLEEQEALKAPTTYEALFTSAPYQKAAILNPNTPEWLKNVLLTRGGNLTDAEIAKLHKFNKDPGSAAYWSSIQKQVTEGLTGIASPAGILTLLPGGAALKGAAPITTTGGVKDFLGQVVSRASGDISSKAGEVLAILANKGLSAGKKAAAIGQIGKEVATGSGGQLFAIGATGGGLQEQEAGGTPLQIAGEALKGGFAYAAPTPFLNALGGVVKGSAMEHGLIKPKAEIPPTLTPPPEAIIHPDKSATVPELPKLIEDYKPATQEIPERILKEFPGLNQLPKEELDKLLQKHLSPKEDEVLGFTDARTNIDERGTTRHIELQNAIKYGEEHNLPIQYAEMDIRNLGGLNSALSASKANGHLREMANIIKAETGNYKGKVMLFRHGGDELSAVAVGLTKKELDEALTKAGKRIDEYVSSAGLSDIMHPKGGRKGTGIYHSVVNAAGEDYKQVIGRADSRIEDIKKEFLPSLSEVRKKLLETHPELTKLTTKGLNAIIKEKYPNIFKKKKKKEDEEDGAGETTENGAIAPETVQSGNVRGAGENEGQAGLGGETGEGSLPPEAIGQESIAGSNETPVGGLDSLPEQDREAATKIKELYSHIDPTYSGLTSWANDAFVPINTRIKEIDAQIGAELEKFEYNSLQAEKKHLDTVAPFVSEITDLKKKDRKAYDTISHWLRNGDFDKIDTLATTKGWTGWRDVKSTLNTLYKEQAKYNKDIQYRKNYFPSAMKNFNQFAKEVIGEKNVKTDIEKMIKSAEQSKGRALTEEEKINVSNTVLAGYATGLTPGHKFARSRQFETVPKEWMKYYMPPEQSLLQYIRIANEDIQKKKFFGKSSEGLDNSGSIGKFILDKIQSQDLDFKKARELNALLESRFKGDKMNDFLAGIRDMGYLATMNNYMSTLTQLQDIAISAYKNDVHAIPGLLENFNPKISLKDLNLEHMTNEFIHNPSFLGKSVEKMFHYLGLSQLDKLGKQTFINSTLRKFQSRAKANDPDLVKDLQTWFGDEAGQTLKDLQERNPTENVKALMFGEITGYYPVTRSSMPKLYNDMPNGRILYQLKSFMIKQLNFLRNELREGFRKNPIEGTRRLAWALMTLGSMGMGVNAIKSFVMGEDVDVNELMISTIFNIVGLSSYSLEKIKTEGNWSFVIGQIVPVGVTTPSNYIAQDIRNGDISKTLNLIPFVGKLAYKHEQNGQLFGGLF